MIWNQWYTACASSRLAAGPVAARVLDREIVLWRDGGGVARAHIDRCCHRGYKLSLSRVVDGQLECGFHGWRYDASEACVHVPSLRSAGRVPTSFCVPRLECVEKDGYVWVWMTKQGVRPRGEPAIPEFEASRWLQGSMDMACAAARGIEINLDGAHVYFVHPSHPQTVAFRQRGASRADSQHEMRVTDRGLIMFWPPAASASEPIPPQAARIQFELPNLIRIQTPGDGRTLLLFFVPTGPRTCRLDYLITQPNPAGPKLFWLEVARDPRAGSPGARGDPADHRPRRRRLRAQRRGRCGRPDGAQGAPAGGGQRVGDRAQRARTTEAIRMLDVIYSADLTERGIATPLEGTWHNADWETDGMFRLTIERDGGQLILQPMSARHAAYDWGTLPALAYTIDVNPAIVVAFTATYRTARSQTLLVGRVAPDMLTVDSYTHFTDDSQRADHVRHDVFVRR